MMNEAFDKECIPEIRAMGEPSFIASLPSTGYGAKTLRLNSGESWECSKVKLEALRRGRDFLRLCDYPGFCALAREMHFPETARRIEEGDDMAAKEIEKILATIESQMLITTGTHIEDDVTGAVPNVPAFLQGQPLDMQSMHDEKNSRGPISLFLETTTSSGFEGREALGRIAAMVALARTLAIYRPLNLWLNISWGGIGKLTQTSIQIETNPIDLSRLAAVCSNLGDVNRVGNRASAKQCQNFINETGFAYGSWAYDIPILERKFAGEILSRVISPGSEVAYLPAGLLGTDDLRQPHKWVERMMQKFAPYLFDGGEWEAA